MTDLDKARVWAERMGKIEGLMPGHRAAAEVIQSLPDQWVDAEKVRKQIDIFLQEAYCPVTHRDIGHAYQKCADALKDLITPKLPTLADMTQEEREACQWMQCRAKGFSEDERLVIAHVDDHWVTLWREAGHSIRTNPGAVTPLPGPKLEWPGSPPQGPTGASLDPQENIDASIEYIKKTASDQEPNDSETPKSSIKPEDVPDNDLWLVMLREEEWVGRRSRKSRDYPWYIASPNGEGAEIAQDSEITLIHKLVPETHTLPEGMRLADHAEYGRVVTSPRADADYGYKIFFLNEDVRAGADYEFAHESTLTFLDGEPDA